MSKALQQGKSREYQTFTTTSSRGKDRAVRVPQFPKDLIGDSLMRALGRLAYTQANENRDKAVALVESWLSADFQLLQRVHDINLISRECVDYIVRSTRPPMRMLATSPTPALKDGTRRYAERNLMEFALVRGVKMKDATIEILEAEIREHRPKALTMLQHAKWCEAVMKLLPDTKTKVSDVLQNADLIRLLEKAQKDVA